MNINKNNYESWFLDYYEGVLTAEQVAELFLFLEKNPELKNEFESFALITLPDSKEVFAEKNELKKNVITLQNYTDYLIAELEGDLNLQERIALKTFMDVHPELEKDRTLFHKTVLQKEAVIYSGKKQLKKLVVVPLNKNYVTLWIAAAAIILLMIGVYFIQSPEKVRVAQQEENHLQKTVSNNATLKTNSQVAVVKNPTIKKYASNSDSVINNSIEVINHPTKNKINEETLSNKNLASISVKSKNNSSHHKKVKEIKQEEPVQNNIAEFAMLPAARIESSLQLNRIEEFPVKLAEQTISVSSTIQKHNVNPLHINDETAEHFPLKSKIVKAVAWFVNKASNNNVKMNADFDVNGNLAAYQLAAGKFRVEKNF